MLYSHAKTRCKVNLKVAHASRSALVRRPAGPACGRRQCGGNQAVRARGHGERRRAADGDAARRDRCDRRGRQGQDAAINCAKRRPRTSNFSVAEKLAGAAITAAPKDPANWLAYAGIAAAADDAKANDRYDLVTRGATAAYAAYQRSTTPDAQAAALAVLADLLARHEQWRPALDALKASLDRRDSVDGRKTYEAMRAEHGFRILDYKVDNESALPRVCFNFSEAARAQDRFFALCRGIRLIGDGDLERGSANLRRRPQAWRALRDRAAPGPAFGSGRIAAQVGRLRDLRARPLAAGAFRRAGLTCCRARVRRARRSSPSTPRRSRSTSIASATAICWRPSIATTF